MTTVQASATGTRIEREEWAETLLDRLTPAMSALGVIFVLVVLGEQLARSGSPLSTALTIAGWLLWAVFVVEFVARLVVAPDTGRFWRRNWWQVAFLVLPFLRVLRLIRAVRLLRTGRVLSSTVRGSRSAHSLLGGRLGWLGAVVAITVLGASQLLYQFSDYSHYGLALHDAALAAITGEPLQPTDAFADVLEVVLAIFSVVVFGSFAAVLGRLLPRPANSGPRRGRGGSTGAAVDRRSRWTTAPYRIRAPGTIMIGNGVSVVHSSPVLTSATSEHDESTSSWTSTRVVALPGAHPHGGDRGVPLVACAQRGDAGACA